MYVSAPSNGAYHRYPTDNWRFYPDSGKALSDYANKEGFNTKLLESFIGAGDFVAVLIKDEQFTNLYSNRIYNIIPKILEPENIWVDENKEILNYKSNMKSNNLLGEESDIIFSEL